MAEPFPTPEAKNGHGVCAHLQRQNKNAINFTIKKKQREDFRARSSHLQKRRSRSKNAHSPKERVQHFRKKTNPLEI